MTKPSDKTDVAASRSRNEEKTQTGLSRVVGSKWHYVLVLVFAALLGVGIWSRPDQVMVGDDYAFHVARLQSAAQAWRNGQILPQVDPEALGGFGYAYNLFYGPLVTYVAAGLEFVIGSWPIVINLILVLCLMGAGFMMCYAMTRVTKNRMLALLIAVIYMASPYLLNNIYSRMALGEVTAAVAAPILLLGLYQLTAHEKHAARSLAVAAALLILSHSLSAMIFALMAAVYVLINIDKVFNVRCIWRMILAVAVALGLTAFFTAPLIEARLEGNYGVFNQEYAEAYFGANPQSVNDHRVWPQQLVTLDYASGEYGVALGVMAMIGILGFWFAWRTIEDRGEQRFVTSLYIIGMLAIVGMLPLLNWQYLPSVFWNIQFPWRLMMVAMTVFSVVAGYTIFALVRRMSVEKQAVWAIMAGVLAVYVVTPVIMPNDDRHLEDFSEAEEDLATVGFQAEYAPVGLLCAADDEEDVEKGYACSLERIREELKTRGTKLSVLEGQVKTSKAIKDGLNLEFDVRNTSERAAVVELPLIWYPGYRVRMDGVELVSGQSEDDGLVTVVVPAGVEGTVQVRYELTKPTELGLMISAGTAGLGVVWVMISGVYDWYKRRKQKEVDSLIDSVWEAMAENESLDDGGAEATVNKPKKRAAKRKAENVLPEPPEPEVPGLMPNEGAGGGAKRSSGRKTKPAASKKKADVSEAKDDVEQEKGAEKSATKKTTTRKTTARVKSVKAKEESSEAQDEVKPRVTKVKAGSKKEV